MPDDRLIATHFNELDSDDLEERLALVDKLQKRTERQPSLVFVGRDSIRKEMRDFVSYLRDEPFSSGFLKIIQGAPGAGKTSLLHQLEKDLDGDEVTCIRVESDTLNSPRELLERFVNKLGGSLKKVLESVRTKTGGRLGTSGTGISHERETGQLSFWEAAREHESFWSLLNRAVEIPQDRVIVLMIDETQQQRDNLTDSFKRIARQLHAGDTNGIKVLPVFAGLGDTADTLRECGLSRLAGKPIQLGSLTYEEAIEVVVETLNLADTGLDGMFSPEHVQKTSVELAVASEGWPRHLHSYITAFAMQCVTELKKDPNRQIDLDAVLDQGHLNRHSYYRDRLAGISEPMIKMLTEWVSTSPQQVLITTNGLLEFEEQQGMFQEALEQEIDDVVRAGVLQVADDDAPYGQKQYEIPIPSMRTYLLNGGIGDQTLEAFRKEQEINLAVHFKGVESTTDVNLEAEKPDKDRGFSR